MFVTNLPIAKKMLRTHSVNTVDYIRHAYIFVFNLFDILNIFHFLLWSFLFLQNLFFFAFDIFTGEQTKLLFTQLVQRYTRSRRRSKQSM